MEDLFSASLSINNKMVNYRIVFDNDQYHFLSADSDNNTAFKNFSFKREHDEWHEQQEMPDDFRNEAIHLLEKYLLKQH